MTSRRIRHRLGAGLTAAAAAVAGATVIASPAAAEPLTDDPTVATASVTLITGDVAVVEYSADGNANATLTTTQDYYTQAFGDDLYVVPTVAAPLLAAGDLDTELFNVTGLVRSGYDDASRDDIPLISTGSTPTARGLDKSSDLASLDASAVSVDKAQAADVFDSLNKTRSSGGKLWLDAMVEGFELDPGTGVPQTGADQVWDLGYDGEGITVAVLDTGYDADHPDLVGQVADEADFTGGESTNDTNGHGTHVASTIAGTGEASDGARSGAAPGADLIVGKVLGPGGGQASWIIAGMEWAVESGADVVNMSLGSVEPTDCTDPIAESVRSLTEQDETVFVVAAGNNALRETITSPACVESVITVGAVDADGQTADFSSRGPTTGGFAVKPDIAAPGVATIGAAAGSPGDIHYTQKSGTSMAAPHVAAAAALVRQANPDWGAEQVKQALTSNTKDKPTDTVYAQGAGELWVPDAVESEIIASASVSLGQFEWPHDGSQTATRSVTYTNVGDKNVTLKLKVTDFVGAGGDKMPKKALSVGAKKVVVPAGGSVTVPVYAVDTTKGVAADSFGEISARIVATGGGHKVTTAVGYWLEPETVDLSMTVTDRAGQPAANGYVDVFHMDIDVLERYYFDGSGTIDLRARVGAVAVSGFVATAAADSDKSYTYIGEPELKVSEDTTLAFDARDSVRVKVDTEQASQARGATLHYTRDDGKWLALGSVYSEDTDVAMYVIPTQGKKAKTGDFTLTSLWRLYAAGVETGASPFVYNLGFTETGKVGKKHDHTVKDSALAVVDETFYAQREAGTYFDSLKALSRETEEVFAGMGMTPIATPGERTAYFSPGMAWQQLGVTADSRLGADIMFDPYRSYRAGDHSTTTWNRLPSHTGLWQTTDGAPGRVAERQGNLMGFAFAQWKDAEGRYGIGAFGDGGNLTVYENGELLGQNGLASGQITVLGEEADYEVTVGQRRLSVGVPHLPDSHLAIATQTTFGFTSQPVEGEQVAPLPVLLPTYDLDVDLYNLVEPVAETPITVDFATQGGQEPADVVSVTAEVSFDETDPLNYVEPSQMNWQDAKVELRDGSWTVLVDNSDASGGYPSLHISATDADGNTVDQYVVRLYGVA